jgi:hypothetical protein
MQIEDQYCRKLRFNFVVTWVTKHAGRNLYHVRGIDSLEQQRSYSTNDSREKELICIGDTLIKHRGTMQVYLLKKDTTILLTHDCASWPSVIDPYDPEIYDDSNDDSKSSR